MKKTLLATAILSGLVSASAQAATVYDKDGTTMKIGGRVEVRGDFLSEDGGELDGTMYDMSRARINFKGKTKISEGLTGFAKMEYEIKQGENVKNRYLFAGIGTNFGDFSYGRQDTANVQISDMTDIASEHSGIQKYIDASDDKQSNTFVYSIEVAEAVTIQADYSGSEEVDSDAYGISALWSSDFGLDLGASYSGSDSTDQTTVGVAYTLNDLYLGATYAMGSVADGDDFTSLEAAVQYKFTKEFRLIGIYGMSDEDVAGDTNDYMAIEGQYRYNKSIRTYASYKLNNLDGQDDSLLLGLRYNF